MTERGADGRNAEPLQSVSRVDCMVSVRGKGTATMGLFRHLAPLTVNALMRALPIQSRANVQEAMVCLFTSVRVGVEKARTSFSPGEVAFLPSNALICLFMKNVQSERPLNPIGRIDGGIGLVNSIKPGDVIELRLVQEATVQT